MEQHLYIIGNGFDIHHDIPSKYYDRQGGDCFRKWLNENECETLCEIDDTFGYQNDEWWMRFEENLASVEALRVAAEEAFEHYPNIGSDDFHDRDWYEAEIATELKLNKVFSDITEAFEKWISQLRQGNSKKKLRLRDNSLFLSFNYTNTLEDLYGVPPEKILHIHGSIEKQPFILGHGLKYAELQQKIGETETDDEVYRNAEDSALYCIASKRKKVENIISGNQVWFEHLSDITHIHIFGHSLGDVDMPYFNRIFEVCDRNKVYVEYSCRNDEEGRKARSVVKSALIPLSHFRTIDLRCLQVFKERYH